MHLCCKAMFIAVYNFAKFKGFGHTFVMLNVWLRKIIFLMVWPFQRMKLRKNTAVSSLHQIKKISELVCWEVWVLWINLITRDICHGSRQMCLPSVKNHIGFASFQESKKSLIPHLLSRAQGSGTAGWFEDSPWTEHTFSSYKSYTVTG